MRKRVRIGASVALVAIGAAAALFARWWRPREPAVVIVDESLDELFSIRDRGFMGYSQAADILRRRGYIVVPNTTPLPKLLPRAQPASRHVLLIGLRFGSTIGARNINAIRAFGIVLALALNSGRARAQVIYGAPTPTEAADTTLQRRCQWITATLDTSTSPADLQSARESIGLCELSGGLYIARLWHDATADHEALSNLVRNTRMVRDQRVMDTMVVVASDPGRPTAVRLAALNGLAAYADPMVAEDPLAADTLQVLLQWESATPGTDGAVPLAPGARDAVTTLYQNIAQSDPDTTIRAQAGRLAKAFDLDARATAGKAARDPSKITLTYICGNKFRIRNANPVAIRIQYAVYNAAPPVETTLPTPPAGKPYSETVVTALAAGTVGLFLDGDLIQTAENGDTPCTQ